MSEKLPPGRVFRVKGESAVEHAGLLREAVRALRDGGLYLETCGDQTSFSMKTCVRVCHPGCFVSPDICRHLMTPIRAPLIQLNDRARGMANSSDRRYHKT